MPLIVLALNIPTIAVPKRKVFAVSRIYLLPHSFRKQKICFNQCRFLFQKLRTWKSKLTCGRKSQFLKEEVLTKILKPNFPKRRRSWTSLFRCILTATLNVILTYSEKTFSFVKKQSLRKVLRILDNREKIGSNPILKDKTLSCHWGELWEFTASAVGGKGFEKIDSAILASAKSLHILNSEQVTTGAPVLAFARTFFERNS